jgi:ABC-type transporter Mla subunit MlaD
MNWRAIKGMFVEVEEDEKEVKGAAPTIEPQTPPLAAPPPHNFTRDPSSGKPDQSIIDNLAHALEQANLPGFDYFEFAQILEKLAPSTPAEQIRFQTAFASASVMGATKAKLLETAQHYMGILQQEANNFSGMVQEQIQSNITDKKNSVIEIEETIKQKSETINQLTQEINELSTSKTSILNEAAENRIKIEKVQNDFAACLKILIDKINGDSERINKYIQD